MSIEELINNDGIDLTRTDYYAVILGESPSKGAKSPSLWNAAFKGLGLSGFMHPMDLTPEKLPEIVRYLRKDKRFIGGAVTMPYKIDIIPYLDELEPEAEKIGAVNCIYRNGEKLFGTNTDGAGALWSLQHSFGSSLSGKSAALLGLGGAGMAVAVYLAGALGSLGKMILANRTTETSRKMAEQLKNVCQIEVAPTWPITGEILKETDIVINCTSIGFETLQKDRGGAYSLKYFTPLGSIEDSIRVPDRQGAENEYIITAASVIAENHRQTIEFFAMNRSFFFFDIIYQPIKTPFLFLAELSGRKTLNGEPMNLEQAVIAFDKAVSASGLCNSGKGNARDYMKQVY